MSKNSELLKKVANLCLSCKSSFNSHSLSKATDSANYTNSTKNFHNEFFTLLNAFEAQEQLAHNGLIIAGLGNPSEKYAANRHNVGFMIVDKIAQILELEWENASKFQAQITTLKGKNIHFIKPQSFMNLSGQPIKNALRFYKINHLFVLHDELDIDFGLVRFKIGGSSGGHNGLKSIDSEVGNDYVRLRFGIGHTLDKKSSTQDSNQNLAQHKSLKNHQVISYVLGDFDDKQQQNLNELILHCALSVIFFIITGDFSAMQNLFTLNPAKIKPNKTQKATLD